MAQTIKIKRSATSGNKLTGSNSVTGEFGLNTADKSLYIQTGSTDASVVTVYDDGILHLDDTNNRVGIGTNSPSRPLHVVGHAKVTGDLQVEGGDIEFNQSSGQARIRNLLQDTYMRFQVNVGGTQTNALNIRGNNGFVGIGSTSTGTSPVYPLDVYNVTAATVARFTSGNNRARINIKDDDTDVYVIAEGSKMSLGFASSLSGTNLTIDPDGRLLINTTSSIDNLSQLHIVGYTSGRAGITLQDGDSTTQKTFLTQSSGTTRFNTQNGTSYGSFVVGGWNGTTSADFVTVNASGNVGIGTTSPQAKLDVSGVGNFSTGYNTFAGDGLHIQCAGTSGNGNYAGGISFSRISSDNNTRAAGIAAVQTETDVDRVGLAFFTHDTNTTANDLVEAMRIDSAGKVGIGTTAPTKSLHLNFNNTDTDRTTGNGFAGGVAGDGFLIQNTNTAASTYANLDFRAGTADARIVYQYTGATNQGDFHFITDNTNSPATAMTIKNDGKVGIGDTTPSYKLDVNGTFRTTGNGYFDGSNINFSTAGANIKFNGGGGYISTTTAHALRLQTNNTEALRLTSGQDAVFAGTISSGNITAGNSSTSASIRAHYNDGSYMTLEGFGLEMNRGASYIRPTTDGDKTLYFGMTDASLDWASVRFRSTAGLYLNGSQFIDASRNLTNIGTISSSMVQTTGGRVAIGNTSHTPNSTVDIKASSPAIRITDTAGGNRVTLENNAGTFRINKVGNELVQIFTNGNERFSVETGGAIRFNDAFTFPTTDGSTNQVLKTDGSGNVTWATEAATSASTTVQDADGDTKIQVEESADEDSIRFDTAGTQRMRILANGFVAIGNGADLPTEKLHVFDNINNSASLTTTGTNTRGAIVKIENDNTTSGAWAGFDLRTNTGDARIAAVSTSTNDNDADLAFIVDDKSAGVGVERLRIKGETGNIGIGTTSPSAALHVQKAANVTTTTESVGDFFPSTRIKRSGGSAKTDYEWEFQIGSSGNLNFKDITNSYYPIILNTVGDVRLSSDTSGQNPAMLVQRSTGRVGIGTTSPTNELHVASGQILVGSNTGAGVHINSTGSLEICRTAGGADPFIDFKDDATQDYDVRLQMDAGHFKIANTGGERVRVESGGNVGIGTTTPDEFSIGSTYKYLAVGGDKPGIINLVDSGTSGSYLQFGTAAGVRRASIHTDSGSSDLAFTLNSSNSGTSLTERFRIKASNGYVGIGTNNPIQRLQVAGSIYANGGNIFIDSGNRLIWGNSQQFIEATNSGPMQFGTGNAERMRIETGGNVGIGTTAPQSKIEVNLVSSTTSSLMNANTVNDVQLIRAPYSSTAATTSNAGAKWGLRFVGRNDSTYDNQKSGAIYAVSEDSGLGYNRSVGLAFHTSGFDSNHSERMRITSGGNVGIGTSSPNRKLHLSGSGATVAAKIEATDGNQASVDLKNSEGEFRIISNGGVLSIYDQTDTAERFRIDTLGRVGIGETSPSHKLQVNGNIRADGHYYVGGSVVINSSRIAKMAYGTAAAPSYTFNGDDNLGMYRVAADTLGFTTGGTERMRIASNGDILGKTADVRIGSDVGAVEYGTSTANSVRFYSADAERMRITSAGNVGIGITAPTSQLHLSKAGGTLIKLGTSQNTSEIEARESGSANLLVFSSNNSVDHMTIDSVGRVGIGTTSPSRKLTVQGTSDAYIKTDATSHTSWTIGSDTYGFLVYDDDVGGIDGYRIVVSQTSGNVGVGTTSPAEKFHVEGNVRLSGSIVDSFGEQLNFQSNDLVQFGKHIRAEYGLWARGATARAMGIDGSNGYMGLYTNTTEKVRIDSSGNVGIGTTSPQAKLQIEEAGIDTTTTSTSATTQVAIDTFAAATFRSARYTIQVTNSTDSTYHLTEILLIHDGTTPAITEFGTIFTGSAEATFDADISSGNVRLLATPASTDSMTFKVVRHCITV